MTHYFELYQIKDVENTDYTFRPWSPAVEKNFNLNDYKRVFRYDFPECFEPDVEDEVLCDFLFHKINYDRAVDGTHYPYQGWSPSVSDVFCISGKAYYCDISGWVKLDI
jgi:hypothetical protein